MSDVWKKALESKAKSLGCHFDENFPERTLSNIINAEVRKRVTPPVNGLLLQAMSTIGGRSAVAQEAITEEEFRASTLCVETRARDMATLLRTMVEFAEDTFEQQPVDSENIEMAGYSEATGIVLRFRKNGRIYGYPLTTRQTYNQLLDAESKGKFFHATFRNEPFVELHFDPFTAAH